MSNFSVYSVRWLLTILVALDIFLVTESVFCKLCVLFAYLSYDFNLTLGHFILFRFYVMCECMFERFYLTPFHNHYISTAVGTIA